MMTDFDEKQMQAARQSRWVGQHIIYHPTVGSTNDDLKTMVAQGTAVSPPAGTVVLTDYQSRGRGRFDRRWEAPPATSLLFSVLFRPNWPADYNHWLMMLAGVAAAEAIAAQTGLDVRIKWPNDVVLPLAGEWRKVSGLLLEGNLDANGRCQSAVLGMGINVNVPQSALPAAPTPPTSLLVATGHAISRRVLLLDLLARLEHHYEAAASGRSPQPLWQQYLMTLGQPVTVTQAGAGEAIVGTAVATGEWGQLLVQDSDGRVHTILAGDVTLRPPAPG